MEIYKNLNTPQSKEFEQLLNNQLSKVRIEEGKIIDGKINKITEKFVFLFVEGLKSEPVLDINELKTMGLNEKIKIGEKISVLLEKLEDKMGEVVVSASKAQKIKGWDVLVKAYEQNEPIIGKFISKTKGGAIVENIEKSIRDVDFSDPDESQQTRRCKRVMNSCTFALSRFISPLSVSERTRMVEVGRSSGPSTWIVTLAGPRMRPPARVQIMVIDSSSAELSSHSERSSTSSRAAPNKCSPRIGTRSGCKRSFECPSSV